jgi:hypothetical protein
MVKLLQLAVGAALIPVALAEPTPIGEILVAALIADAFGVKLPI